MMWTDKEIYNLRCHYSILKTSILQKKYLPNKSTPAIHNKASRLKLHKKRHSLEVLYFNKINKFNAYWAGFIAADGHLRNRDIKIGLQYSDKNHLQLLKNAVKFDGQIKKGFSYLKKTKKIYYSAILLLNGDGMRCMIEDLQNKFNIPIGSKSHILESPNLKTLTFVRSFIRGYFDGDGGLTTDSNNQCQLTFTGTYNMMEWIKFNIKRCVNEVGDPSICSNGSVYSIPFHGNYQAYKILAWLYKDSKNMRLNRKYNVYLHLKQYYISKDLRIKHERHNG